MSTNPISEELLAEIRAAIEVNSIGGTDTHPVVTADGLVGDVVNIIERLIRLYVEGHQVHGLPPLAPADICSALVKAPAPVETFAAIKQAVGECLAGLDHQEVSLLARRKIEAAIDSTSPSQPQAKGEGE